MERIFADFSARAGVVRVGLEGHVDPRSVCRQREGVLELGVDQHGVHLAVEIHRDQRVRALVEHHQPIAIRDP